MFWFFIRHPFHKIELTIVRRYVDAQGNYIGELYEGQGRQSHMIGVSCDNFPLDADMSPIEGRVNVCYSKSFLEPMPASTLRVGAWEPTDNERVQAYVGKRRLNIVHIGVMNRFVEHVMNGKTI